MDTFIDFTLPADDLLSTALTKYNRTQILPALNFEKKSLVQKLMNERQMQKLLYRLIKDLEPYEAILKNKKSHPIPSTQEMNEVTAICERYLIEIHERNCLFDGTLTPFVIEHGFFNTLSQLFLNAQVEDSELSKDDLIKALRHILIMNCLQLYFGKNIDLSLEVYAFGVLYPYEDNYLDDPSVTIEEKKRLITG